MASRNVNILMVIRVVGWLLLIESAFMAIPALTSLIYGESDFTAFAITIGITLASGSLFAFALHPRRTDMSKREGFLLTALVWVVFSFFGMIPFMIGEAKMSFSDAYFEAMSGFSTTGASVMTSISHLSKGILMWRCLMQWIGGMGIILFTLAVVPMLNHSGGMQMFNAEVTGITHDKIRPRISQTAKGLWGIYLALTVLLVFFLWLGPMNFFDSICHAFSTISTGGFSTSDNSIADYNSVYLKIILTLFMFLGGTNFALMYKAVSGDTKPLRTNDVFRAYLYIIGFFLVLFVISLVLRGQATNIEAVTIDPLFQIISLITSTGLSVCDYEAWGHFLMTLMMVLMFFGACAGSTSGGAKIDRLLFLIKNTRNEIYRSLHPNAMVSVRVNDKVVPEVTVSKVIAFLCLYVIIVFIGGVLLTAVGLPIVDAFFSSFSCLSNTGLGAGVTGYGNGFEAVPDIGKWILAALMLIGRLEIFTVIIIFTKSFWRR